MVLLIPGLALAPELYAAYQPHVSIYDPWGHSWTHADFEFDSPEQVTLIGHSLGGLVALEWALQFPERINALILLDPTFPALHTQLHSPRFSSLISQIASPFIPLAFTPFVDRAVIQQRYRGKKREVLVRTVCNGVNSRTPGSKTTKRYATRGTYTDPCGRRKWERTAFPH